MSAGDELDIRARAAIRRVLERPLFELIPLKNALEQAAHLPDGATVSVTASPGKGMDATMDLVEELHALGFDVVPHLSARLTEDRMHLGRILKRIDHLGIRRAFVVGGDADPPGDFFDGLALLTAMEEIGHGLEEIGIPGYPEGHALIPDGALDRALLDKQRHATSVTTQLCFSPEAIVSWLRARRASGLTLPVVLGMPGVADRLRLLKISTRIGVGESVRFLRKNAALAGRLALPGSYNPAELLEGLGADLDDPTLHITGVHIYTFNACDSTEAWRRSYLEELA